MYYYRGCVIVADFIPSLSTFDLTKTIKTLSKNCFAYLTTKSSSVSRIDGDIVHTSGWKPGRWIDTGFVGENVWYEAQCLDWVLSKRDNSQKYQKKEEHDDEQRRGWGRATAIVTSSSSSVSDTACPLPVATTLNSKEVRTPTRSFNTDITSIYLKHLLNQCQSYR